MNQTESRRYAYYALTVLTLLNLLNYVDRYVFSAMLTFISADTGFSDAQLGVAGSAFTVMYTVCSPLFGYLGDRYRRGRLISIGIVIWSIATAGAGVARTFGQMLASRALVGIGEANYATIAPGLLSDFFVKERRGFVMSLFFITIPIGAAIGYVAGGVLGAPQSLGWRNTLFLVGLPGLLTAGAAWMIHEPSRGAMDGETGAPALGLVEGYRLLLRNRGYVYVCLGYAAITFAVGALVFWAPKWLHDDKGVSETEATIILGACVVVGGLVGTLVGGIVGDRLLKRGVRNAYFWVCAGGALLAAPFSLLMLVSATKWVYTLGIFLGVTLVLCGNGPVNALLVNLVPSKVRTTALGLAVVVIHLLGDFISVSMVGRISTSIQQSKSALPQAVVWLGRVFHINPATQSLSVGLLLMPAAMLAGALMYWLGSRTAEARQA